MNRWLIFAFLILCLFPVRAALLTIEDPCTGKAVQRDDWREELPRTVGSLTVATLQRAQIPYLGNEVGIHSMLGTPLGDEALEIINRMEMRSYGWCYEVDGEVPESLPNTFVITSKHKKITWFFGYAHYVAGEWVSQCEKVSDTRPPFICSE